MRLLQFLAALCLLSVIPAKADQFGDFTYTATATEVTITGYTGAGGVVTIPSSISGLSVTSIGYQAFSGCTGLTSITIPNSVTSIGSSAFYGCTGLTSVTIGSGVTSIGEYAFYDCTGLTSVTVDSANPNYSSLAGVLFDKNQTALIQYPAGKTGSYTIPNSVTSIGTGAFGSCTGLTSITIPNSVTSIGTGAFGSCTGLTSITIPNSVTSIGSSAFNGCTGLTSVTTGSGVTSIGEYAFYGCTGLTSVTIPNSVTSIEELAFYGCTGLTSVTIGSGVTSIARLVFLDCTGLTSVTVDSANPNYSSMAGVLFNKNQTSLIQYPAGKTGSYTIPNSVTSIDKFAFMDCTGLTSVTIGSSVTSIGDYAFNGCSALTSATFLGNAPSIRANIGYERSFASNAIDFKVYFFSGKSGFTAPTWMGYPSVSMGAPSALSPWLISYGYPHDADLEADSNGDGVSLLLAYSLNLDPRQNLSDRTPRPVFTSNQMNLTFYAGSEGVSYKVESSIDLQSWTTEGVSLFTPDINKFRTATVSTTDPCRFMRIVVAY